MPAIKPQNKLETEPLAVAIDKSVAADLKLYGEFVQSPRAYVVQELLRDVMRRDKDFQAFLAGRRAVEEVPRRGKKQDAA